jgi:hypothetical protein
MLAMERGPTCELRGSFTQFDGWTEDLDAATDGMVHLIRQAACFNVWVREHFGIVVNRAAGHPGFFEERQPVCARLGAGDSFDVLLKLATVLDATRVFFVFRAFDLFCKPHCTRKAFPGALICGAEREVAIRAANSLIGGRHAMCGAHRFWRLTSSEILRRFPDR